VRRLACAIQEYEWGHPTWLPDLLDQPERKGRPSAELWMGAHPSAPSKVDGVGLDRLIVEAPIANLGSDVSARFGQLPYLFKVLAIDRALSIQSHPSLEQARAGFARENEAQTPLDAPNRTYRDDNHKPEMICAVTPFEALCGFRSLVDAHGLLDALSTPALEPLRAILSASGEPQQRFAASLEYLLRLETVDATVLVDEVVAAMGSCSDPRYLHVTQSLQRVASDYPDDVGVVVGLLLNHITLEPGQALFLGPGNLHAYLSGVGVELMANSDNVIRGGLTPKHIDLDELLAVVDCSPLEVPTENPTSSAHTFSSPVEEFALSRVDLSAGGSMSVVGPAIVLLTEGSAGGVCKGQPVFIAAGDHPWALTGTGMAWVATVGRPHETPLA
jgi:mannose-6-phosphate isomerase